MFATIALVVLFAAALLAIGHFGTARSVRRPVSQWGFGEIGSTFGAGVRRVGSTLATRSNTVISEPR